MMNLAYDLYIRSCLPPCGDDDMTPTNIASTATLKELDVVVLTDHNTYRNRPTFMAAAIEYSVLAVPGMEISMSEGVHAVCLFPTLEKAPDFGVYVYGKLIKFPNRERIFGKQQIYDNRDQVYASEPNSLVNVTEISFNSPWNLARFYDGIMFPAHVNRAANSLIANLGFIPPDSCSKTAEVRGLKKPHQLKRGSPYLEQCRIINNSGAHYLEYINETNLTMQMEGRSAEMVVRTLLQEWRLFAAAVLWNS